MKLQTNIPLSKEPHHLIDYSSKLLLIGSCFSENMGEKLKYYQFSTLQNPFGILFQPKSIENSVTNVINKKEYSGNDIFQLNERWHSFDAHSESPLHPWDSTV